MAVLAVAPAAEAQIVLARYAADGTPDASFGVDGVTFDFMLKKYAADGSLESTFGAGGTVMTDFPPPMGGWSPMLNPTTPTRPSRD